jgi:predicted nucleic acid-binding protein
MTNITIDTSALIAVITDEPSKNRIIELTVNSQLLAPSSVHWEIGNAFSAMLKRNRITLSQAQSCIALYQQIPIKFVDVPLINTTELVEQLKIYAYDAYLIQCALQTKTPLLTLDTGLIEAAKSVGITILE